MFECVRLENQELGSLLSKIWFKMLKICNTIRWHVAALIVWSPPTWFCHEMASKLEIYGS